MAWNNNASEYTQHISNYKHELSKNQNNLTTIIKEIKKDDGNIDVSNFSHIESAIRSIKGSRKRWASGSGFTVENNPDNGYWKNGYINLPNLKFDINLVICEITVNNSEDTLILMLYFNGACRSYSLGAYENHDNIHPTATLRAKKSTFNKNKLMFFSGIRGEAFEKFKSVKWYAFE